MRLLDQHRMVCVVRKAGLVRCAASDFLDRRRRNRSLSRDTPKALSVIVGGVIAGFFAG
jgi:hypothetical protein